MFERAVFAIDIPNFAALFLPAHFPFPFPFFPVFLLASSYIITVITVIYGLVTLLFESFNPNRFPTISALISRWVFKYYRVIFR